MTSKSSLTLRLTEPVVFLRGTQGPNAVASQPAMVRGLLTLNLRRASRVKSIEVKLETRTSVIWPEGIGVRRMEIVEEHIIRSQRIVFFDASATLPEGDATVLPARRAISVGPGVHLDGLHDDVSDNSQEEARLRANGYPATGPAPGDDYALPRAMSTARGVGRGYASMIGAEHEPAQEHAYPSGPPPYERTSSRSRDREQGEADGLSPIASSRESRSRSRSRGRAGSRSTGTGRSNSRGDEVSVVRGASSLSPVRGILNRQSSPAASTIASGSSALLLSPVLSANSGTPSSGTAGSATTVLLPPVRPPLGSPRSSNTSLPSQHSAPSIRSPIVPSTNPSGAPSSLVDGPDASGHNSDASDEEYEPESMHPRGARQPSSSTLSALPPGPGPGPGTPRHRVTFARRVSAGALQNLIRRNSRDDARPGQLTESPPGSAGLSGPTSSPLGSLSPHQHVSPTPSPHHSAHFPSPPPSAHNLSLIPETPNGTANLAGGSPSPSLRNFPEPDADARSRSHSRVRDVVEGVKNIFRSSSRPREPVHSATMPAPNGHGEQFGTPGMSRTNSRDSPGPSRPPPTARRGSTDTQRPFLRRGSAGEQTAEPFVEPGPIRGHRSRSGERRGSDAGQVRPYGRGGVGARTLTPHEEGSEERRGRERERGRERSREKSAEAWREFRKGTYTYPIVFPLPPPAPTTVHTEFGTVRYYLVGVVHRSGPFSLRLQGEKEVEVIDVPPDEEPETVSIERQWEESLRYVIGLDNKINLVGGELAFDLTLMPLEKVKIYRLSVAVEEKVDYFSRGQRLTRYDVPRKWDLLNIKSAGKNIPLFPLSSLTPQAGPIQQLLALCPPHQDVSEYAGSLLQLSGPWIIHEVLKLPTCKMGLHRTVRLPRGGAAVKIAHTLKVVIRVERSDGTGNKKWDIMVDTPITLFDCRCSPEYTSLPTYNALLQPVPASSASCACPPRTGSTTPLTVPDSVLRLVQGHTPGPIASFAHFNADSPTSSGPSLVESLAERNRQFARLVEGREDIEGERPPSYDEVAAARAVAGPSTAAAAVQ
ncbi:hypothetical protein CALVIDRAFT_539513 [Calocera viscosa TUFC12733]|uniref:Arrestin C-terminal-like domain-containing protein n=1 Tax=Calocera viscosa (strain TUFC12733) TaxID=1330018 RepID=A0A167JSP0_CALVF|nr:hypothetical protein CALVIDRAFT_539513 [Calocera viscosa TUFC12733]